MVSLPEITSPGYCLKELRKRVPKYILLTFSTAVVLGIATHLYMFANKLPNHDDTVFLLDSSPYGMDLGRWLAPLVLRADGPFSTPWLIGLISILCLAGTACLTVSLLRIRSPLGCAVTAAILVTFPSVTSTLTYMFLADAYFFSLMLAAFGAYATVRFRWGWGFVFGCAAITLSMGIYQSYFGVAAVLMVGALLFETLDGKDSFGKLFLKGVRMVGTLICSLAAYMIIVRITTIIQNIVLSNYQNVSNMGKLSLSELPRSILNSYNKYFSFFLKNDAGYHFGFLKYAFVATALCCVALGLLVLRKRRLGTARTVLTLVLAAVYPLAGNLIYVMVPHSTVHMVMIYGLSYILVAPVALADYAEINLQTLSKQALQAIAGWVILLTISATAYSYAIIANSVYLKMDLSMQQCTAYSIRLLDRIESCEGYHRGMPVVLLGSETGLSPTPQLDSINMTGVIDFAFMRRMYSYDSFLRYYLGYTDAIYLGSSNEALLFSQMDEVRAMPLYPEQGSIQVIDGWIVAKLNENP